MAQSHREASRRLFEVAEQQQGFFTTKQAKAAGFAETPILTMFRSGTGSASIAVSID
jgi:hypothetical protein